METARLNDLTNQINSFNSCAELNEFKNSIQSVVSDQVNSIQSQINDLLTLTNPVTFIANFIIKINKDLITAQSQLNQLNSDLDILMLTVQKKAETLGCTLE